MQVGRRLAAVLIVIATIVSCNGNDGQNTEAASPAPPRESGGASGTSGHDGDQIQDGEKNENAPDRRSNWINVIYSEKFALVPEDACNSRTLEIFADGSFRLAYCENSMSGFIARDQFAQLAAHVDEMASYDLSVREVCDRAERLTDYSVESSIRLARGDIVKIFSFDDSGLCYRRNRARAEHLNRHYESILVRLFPEDDANEEQSASF